MINNFQEIVMQKLDLMEKQLSEIPEMKKQLSEIPEMKKQLSRIAIIEKKVTKIQELATSTEKRTTKIEERTTNIERTVTILEHEFHEKVSALFDGYSMHEEKKEEQSQRINYLDKKVESHDIRILNLEQKIS